MAQAQAIGQNGGIGEPDSNGPRNQTRIVWNGVGRCQPKQAHDERVRESLASMVRFIDVQLDRLDISATASAGRSSDSAQDPAGHETGHEEVMNRFELLHARGNVQMRLENTPDAIKALDAAVKVAPLAGIGIDKSLLQTTCIELALALAEAGNYDAAVAQLTMVRDYWADHEHSEAHPDELDTHAAVSNMLGALHMGHAALAETGAHSGMNAVVARHHRDFALINLFEAEAVARTARNKAIAASSIGSWYRGNTCSEEEFATELKARAYPSGDRVLAVIASAAPGLFKSQAPFDSKDRNEAAWRQFINAAILDPTVRTARIGLAELAAEMNMPCPAFEQRLAAVSGLPHLQVDVGLGHMPKAMLKKFWRWQIMKVIETLADPTASVISRLVNPCLKPEDTEYIKHRILGDMYGLIGEGSLAVQALSEMIAIKQTAEGYVRLGSANIEIGDYQAALQCSEKAIELARASNDEHMLVNGLLSRGSVLGELADQNGAGNRDMNKFTQASEDFKAAAMSDAEISASLRALAWLDLGEMGLLMGRPDEAERHFRQAISFDPTLFEARLGSIIAMQNTGVADDVIAPYVLQAISVMPVGL